MITRTSEYVAVEGVLLPSTEAAGASLARRRVEIDGRTGLISNVGDPRGNADLVLDDACRILPGFIDLHVHAREDPSGSHLYKESFQTAGNAALHGGVVAIGDMPNNPEPPVDDVSYLAKRSLAKSCPVDVLLLAAVGPRTHPLSFPVPYKAYMGPSVGDTCFRSAEALREVLPRYRGQWVAFHAEAPEILARSRSARTHAARRPPEAEVQAIQTALALCESFHVEPHICHLSTAAGLEAIREARRRGLPVSCEVAPHHLYYDQDNAQGFSEPSYLQVNPPIRSRIDRIALLEAFKRDEIDFLATDHAPHSIEEKDAGISGMPHLDTFGAFTFWLRDEGVSWECIQRACSERPGRLVSRFSSDLFGRIEKGFVGSLTVLRAERHTIRRGDLQTRAGWSPFEGCAFGGRVTHTIVRGKIHPQVDD